jgi:hypothetical protein
MAPNRQQDERRPPEEVELFEHLQRIARFRDRRRAVHIHLSLLRPSSRRPDRLRIALNSFAFAVRHIEGQIFALGNADVFFVCKGGDAEAIDDAVMRLCHLLGSEDELLPQSLDRTDLERLRSWYDLSKDYDECLAAARRLLEEERRRSALADPKKPELQPLTPRQLGELVEAIERADLTNMMRRQPVCVVVPDAPPEPVFRELYIAIDVLRQVIMPGHDIAGNRWLFQHLTRTLDQRMLQLLAKSDERALSASYSINLNIATLLSDRFLAFDEGLNAATRGTVVFELQPVDVFADFGAFLFARDFARERGYRICLDGVTDLTLPLVDRDRLGLDLVKIVWQPETQGSGERRLAELREQIAGFGRARTILCRCDSAEAIAFGRSLGIHLFQGRHVDTMIDAGPSHLGIQKLRAAAQSARRLRL